MTPSDATMSISGAGVGRFLPVDSRPGGDGYFFGILERVGGYAATAPVRALFADEAA